MKKNKPGIEGKMRIESSIFSGIAYTCNMTIPPGFSGTLCGTKSGT